MRIVIVDPSLFGLPYDQELCLSLAERGNEVHFYSRPLEKGEVWQAPGTHYHPFFYRALDRAAALPRHAFLLLKGGSHVADMLRFHREMKRLRPDIIHFLWTPVPLIDRQIVRALRKIAPTVMTVHNTRPHSTSSVLQQVGTRTVFDVFDRLIVHTQDGADHLRQSGLPAHRIRQIPHGPLYLETTAERPANEDSRPLFLLVGRIKPYKGVDVMIRAVQLMPEAVRARCRFLVVGKPFIDTAELRQLAQDCGVADAIAFDFRYVEDSELTALLRQAAVLVFPYRAIDASGLLMAALPAGRPIIASRLGLFAEMLEDGRHGRLVPPEDPAALAAAMTALAENSELRRAMGEEVRQLAAAAPTWQSIAEATHALYADARGRAA